MAAEPIGCFDTERSLYILNGAWKYIELMMNPARTVYNYTFHLLNVKKWYPDKIANVRGK